MSFPNRSYTVQGQPYINQGQPYINQGQNSRQSPDRSANVAHRIQQHVSVPHTTVVIPTTSVQQNPTSQNRTSIPVYPTSHNRTSILVPSAPPMEPFSRGPNLSTMNPQTHFFPPPRNTGTVIHTHSPRPAVTNSSVSVIHHHTETNHSSETNSHSFNKRALGISLIALGILCAIAGVFSALVDPTFISAPILLGSAIVCISVGAALVKQSNYSHI